MTPDLSSSGNSYQLLWKYFSIFTAAITITELSLRHSKHSLRVRNYFLAQLAINLKGNFTSQKIPFKKNPLSFTFLCIEWYRLSFSSILSMIPQKAVYATVYRKICLVFFFWGGNLSKVSFVYIRQAESRTTCYRSH